MVEILGQEMRHPHADLIKEWLEDTTRVVEVKTYDKDWFVWEFGDPPFDPRYQWRLKQKPDVFGLINVFPSKTMNWIHTSHTIDPNLKLTFDGETGKLKAAEVIE